MYQILRCPRQNASSWTFLLFLSPRRRSEINMLPWDELQDKDGVEECIHASARQQGPKLSLGLSNFQAGFRTEMNHCQVCSLIPFLVWGSEAVAVCNCTKKSPRNAPYAWRYKRSRKFCSTRRDLDSLNIRIGGSWPMSE